MNYRNRNELSILNTKLPWESIIWNKNINFELHVKNHTSSSTGNNYAFWSCLQCSSSSLGQTCLLVNKLQLNLHSVRVTKGLHFLLERAMSVTMEHDFPFPGSRTVLSLEPLHGCPNCSFPKRYVTRHLHTTKCFVNSQVPSPPFPSATTKKGGSVLFWSLTSSCSLRKKQDTEYILRAKKGPLFLQNYLSQRRGASDFGHLTK